MDSESSGASVRSGVAGNSDAETALEDGQSSVPASASGQGPPPVLVAAEFAPVAAAFSHALGSSTRHETHDASHLPSTDGAQYDSVDVNGGDAPALASTGSLHQAENHSIDVDRDGDFASAFGEFAAATGSSPQFAPPPRPASWEGTNSETAAWVNDSAAAVTHPGVGAEGASTRSPRGGDASTVNNVRTTNSPSPLRRLWSPPPASRNLLQRPKTEDERPTWNTRFSLADSLSGGEIIKDANRPLRTPRKSNASQAAETLSVVVACEPVPSWSNHRARSEPPLDASVDVRSSADAGENSRPNQGAPASLNTRGGGRLSITRRPSPKRDLSPSRPVATSRQSVGRRQPDAQRGCVFDRLASGHTSSSKARLAQKAGNR